MRNFFKVLPLHIHRKQRGLGRIHAAVGLALWTFVRPAPAMTEILVVSWLRDRSADRQLSSLSSCPVAVGQVLPDCGLRMAQVSTPVSIVREMPMPQGVLVLPVSVQNKAFHQIARSARASCESPAARR
jgi:hypothetical protein